MAVLISFFHIHNYKNNLKLWVSKIKNVSKNIMVVFDKHFFF